ncbi:UbiA-like polyprenyltransferase [Acanthopleuribacter pedis]|uniref:4-hydroxybenzoate polyprenyltransferase n=1 Tax=Acanthopleuribacter pedis TaxID=442870 RepID=A0A8J7QM52_9BACT|nr:UbiA-like polyprenyltransferase [Acanthopleuribacter pedis]MBO1320888.1 UbiA family prenyltransferase [Acanthopleuribacter pedis]
MTAAFVETMKMIKIEHSVFALPFALVAAFMAAGGVPEWSTLALIVLAMVCARSAAMAFNRWLDADIDGQNPRTAMRSIPAGRLSAAYTLGFTIVCSLLFIASAWMLNPLAFMLSPLVLAWLLGYSFTKRFTALCHVWLGAALGLAPFGAWVAVAGEIHPLPLALGLAVTGWTAGFDIIYACQDLDFDRANRLNSIPTRLGVHNSLLLSKVLHVAMIAVLVAIGFNTPLHPVYWLGLAMVVACLVYEHNLVRGGNLEKVDMAFFTMNGVVSLVFGFTTCLAVVLH